MAQLRLMPLALCGAALVACNASDAAPGTTPPGVNPPFAPPRAQLATPPAGWVPMPQLATAATGVLEKEKATADAWGEPAMGCYAAIVTFAAKGKAGVLAKALRTQIEAAAKVSDVVEPAANAETGVLALTFERAPYRGRARVAIDAGVTALACFWNDREPVACEAACTALIGSMK